MAFIQISDLTFSYEGSAEPVFSGLTLRLDTDWRLGLIGRNGRGKSTLLRLLEGSLVGTGTLRVPGRCVYLPYALSDVQRPARELLRELAGGAQDWELEREASLLGLDEQALSRSYASLSPGEQTKLQLAGLFLRGDAYPLIDEPTNHLDVRGRELLGRYLAAQKRGFLLVSHDRALLDVCTDHTLALEPSGAVLQSGSFSSYWENRQRREDFERAQHHRLTQDVRRLREAAGRTAAWADKVEADKYNTRNSGLRVDRGHVGRQSARLMQRTRAIEQRRQRAAQEKAELLQNVETAEPLKLFPLTAPQSPVLRAKGLVLGYPGRPLCQGLSFELGRGERVALTGGNGTGKTTLLRAILGETDGVLGGSLRIVGGLTLSYIPQRPLLPDVPAAEYARSHGLDLSQFLTILRKLGFERAQFELPLSGYSAGQQKKVLLAKSLCERAHLYLWDEPLNYIDLYSKLQIEELLLAYRPTLLFVEHDRMFCQRVAQRELRLGGDGAPKAEAVRGF